MRIVIFGDLHDRRDRLSRTLGALAEEQADLCLLTGDIGIDPPWTQPARDRHRRPHDDSVRRVIRDVGEALGCRVLFVPGNHDLRDVVPDSGGTNVDGRIVHVGGIRVAGLGGAGPERFGFPYEWTEDEAEQALGAMFRGRDSAIEIFLSHTPPARTRLDRTARGQHVGSGVIRRWIARVRPALFVCGHIHESSGLEWLDGVPCLNAGALGEPHGRAIVWVLHWEDGPSRLESLVAEDRVAPDRRVWPLGESGRG